MAWRTITSSLVVGATLGLADGSAPALTIARTDTNVMVTWPTSEPAYELEGAADVATPAWRTITSPPGQVGRRRVVGLEIGGPKQYFRLRQSAEP